MKLYELSANYRQLEVYMDQLDDEDIIDAVEMLNEINDESTQKIKNLGKIVKNYESRVDTIDAEIKRLQTMKKVAKNKIDNVKNYILFNMESMQIKKVEDDILPVSLRSSKSVDIIGTVPENFMVVKMESKPDKKAIKEALKADNSIKWACMKSKNSVKIG